MRVSAALVHTPVSSGLSLACAQLDRLPNVNVAAIVDDVTKRQLSGSMVDLLLVIMIWSVMRDSRQNVSLPEGWCKVKKRVIARCLPCARNPTKKTPQNPSQKPITKTHHKNPSQKPTRNPT
jgi:hypothetical protein